MNKAMMRLPDFIEINGEVYCRFPPMQVGLPPVEEAVLRKEADELKATLSLRDASIAGLKEKLHAKDVALTSAEQAIFNKEARIADLIADRDHLKRTVDKAWETLEARHQRIAALEGEVNHLREPFGDIADAPRKLAVMTEKAETLVSENERLRKARDYAEERLVAFCRRLKALAEEEARG